MTDFPKTIKLKDATELSLRKMTAADRNAVLKFARALPEEDLLFLRVDLTQEAVVDEWIANLESGDSVSLLAYAEGEVVGYGTVHRTSARWTRRVGELRVNVAPAFRTRGLGRVLTSEVFDVARELGLKKLMANMTTDQRGAQAAFRRLGFVAEALLSDFVEDRKGNPRDLVIMSYDMDGHGDYMEERVHI